MVSGTESRCDESIGDIGLDVSADTLYQHYVLFGSNEFNRTPYDEEHFDPSSVLPYQGTGADPAAAQPAASKTQTDDSEKILAVEGETYRFPSIHSEEYNYADCMVNITFNGSEISEEEDSDYVSSDLTDYKLPGYEWRTIYGKATTDALVSGTNFLDSKGDFLKTTMYSYDDNIITSCNSVWEELPESYGITHVATFTVSQNGIEYPECKLFEEEGRIRDLKNDDVLFSWYALVPKGFQFNGGLSVGYRGMKLENGEAVSNKSCPAVLFNF